jgi:T5SS/PEP-CTERM-associated repeat protein
MFWSVGRGDGSGVFSVEGNWSGDLLPGFGDVAHFGMTESDFVVPRTYTVSFTSDAVNNAFLIEDDRVTFDLNGHVYAAAHDPFIQSTRIGDVPSRPASLTISDGLVHVESLIFVGTSGHGTLTMSGDGRLQTDIVARVGGFGRIGAVNVNGTGSQWDHDGELTVGWVNFGTGSGTLNITAGGVVQNGKGIVGDGGTGAATVTGADSTWINTGELVISNGGAGTLNIAAGGRVENTVGRISFVAGHAGTVTVDGIDSEWINVD